MWPKDQLKSTLTEYKLHNYGMDNYGINTDIIIFRYKNELERIINYNYDM